ncbi:hypothetical protein GCM10022205_44960 [Spinactinospora alkalitolerans]
MIVEVCDARPGRLLLPSPVPVGGIGPEQEGGRGLPAVTALSGGLCGTSPLGTGKPVWFVLPSGETFPMVEALRARSLLPPGTPRSLLMSGGCGRRSSRRGGGMQRPFPPRELPPVSLPSRVGTATTASRALAGDGPYVHAPDGRRLLDATAADDRAVLGYGWGLPARPQPRPEAADPSRRLDLPAPTAARGGPAAPAGMGAHRRGPLE